MLYFPQIIPGAGGGTTVGSSGVSEAVLAASLNGLISTGSADLRYVPSGGRVLFLGSGSPEGVIAAQSGSLYTDYFSATLYQKLTGASVYGWS